MPHGTVTATIPAASADVFRLLHDYDRRLEWDTLLQAAYLTGDHVEAGLHARAVCQGRPLLGGIALETEYVSFHPPRVAAVRMVNRPAFFETFAATIRHTDNADSSSRIEYIYNFTARPRWLQWVLHPVMVLIFRLETSKRLRSLAAFFAAERHRPVPQTPREAGPSHRTESATGPTTSGITTPSWPS
jgi:hypothetical protein